MYTITLHFDNFGKTERHDLDYLTLAECSRAMRQFIDLHDLGASDMLDRCGEVSKDGRVVGRISYNGRIWDNDNNVVVEGGVL